jgi:hypothetical protein
VKALAEIVAVAGEEPHAGGVPQRGDAEASLLAGGLKVL